MPGPYINAGHESGHHFACRWLGTLVPGNQQAKSWLNNETCIHQSFSVKIFFTWSFKMADEHSLYNSRVMTFACCLFFVCVYWRNLGDGLGGVWFYPYPSGLLHWCWKYDCPYVNGTLPNNMGKCCMDLLRFNMTKTKQNYVLSLKIWVRSRNCGCPVTWFCYQLIAKPGNKTAAVSPPDPYSHELTSL